jgi:hypothetical protein
MTCRLGALGATMGALRSCPRCPTATEPVLETEEILAGIRAWVEIESPTTRCRAVNRMADKVAADLCGDRARIERIAGGTGSAIICW